MTTLTLTNILGAAALALVATAVAAEADPSENPVLTLRVDQIEQAQGRLMIAVFSDGESWSGGQPAFTASAAVEGSEVELELGAVPAGEYGVKLYHDVDGDGELDTNLVGIPTEPFAFSNSAMGSFGPPAWEAVAFGVGEENTVHTISFR
ncbi:DUF2141 domain-containing protein [Marinicauda pacifica]|jgi:uncharacterized protein (DUF2141 family)|uniref:DUF2141 domain-containing protein n=1 Tax=Marinicauda pacifica TaxID=1133559 RepID=UPI0035C7F27F